MKHGGNIWDIAKLYGKRPEEIIDLSASINPISMSPMAKEAIAAAIKLLGCYPEPKATTIRKELASFHGLSIKNILVGNGSTEFIYLIPRIFRSKKALIIEPSFSEYRTSLQLSDCDISSFIVYDEDGFSPNFTKLFTTLKSGYDILYLGNPANPTGVLLDKKTILTLACECEKYGTTLIIDEAFMDFTEGYSLKKEAVDLKNIVILRSMTKFFSMAGLRLGYIVADKKTIELFDRYIPPWSVNTLAIVAGVESLRDNNRTEQTRRHLTSESLFLFQGLRDIPYLYAYPSAANYILVKILLEDISAFHLQSHLLKKGILIRDCTSFIGLNSSFFRIAIKEREENGLFLDMLRQFMIKISGDHKISKGGLMEATIMSDKKGL